MGPTVTWLATQARSEPLRGRLIATFIGTECKKSDLGGL
jgi:hypothetical protein